MKKRKKVVVILAVIAFIMTAAAAVFYMYLSKWHWEDTVFMPECVHDPDIRGDDNSSVGMSFFHVRNKLELKLIYNMNISQGKYYVTIYSIPPGHIHEKTYNATPEEVEELYRSGEYKSEMGTLITDDMIKVYENIYDKSGEYVIDTADFDTGLYALVTHADPDAVMNLSLSYRYKQYNWMKWAKRIISLYSDEFVDTINRYSPY